MPRSRRSRNRSVGTETIPLSQQISTWSCEQVLHEPFTVVSFQYAVVDRGQYYPCELGAVQFSLSGGIHKAYHTFVSPKPLPPGTFAEAKSHADESHQLPFLSNFPHWNTDFIAISENLWSMIGDSDRVFSKRAGDEVKITMGSLEFLDLKTRSGLSSVSVSPVDRLAECIARRFNVCLSSADEIEKYLCRSVHDFDPNVRCFYHEEQDGQHCAYATVFRVFFNLMDFMNEKRVIRVDPASLKVPECFISRHRSHGPTFRYGRKERADPSSNADIGNFGKWDMVSDWCSSQQPSVPIEDDTESDTNTVVNDSMSQCLSEVSNTLISGGTNTWIPTETQGEQRIVAENGVFVAAEPSNTTGGNQPLSQNTQLRMPIIEVIQRGPPQNRILPKTWLGITVESLGDRPMTFLSEVETD